MTEFAEVWHFTRFRLAQAIEGLSPEQVTWRLYPEAHNIAEIVYHIAGCEHYWAARMTGRDPAATDFEALLDLAVHEGFLREGVGGPFREARDLNIEALEKALAFTGAKLRPVIEGPTGAQLAMQMVSPIGNEVTGAEGLARLSQHAGYHTGQIWMIRMSPGFPA